MSEQNRRRKRKRNGIPGRLLQVRTKGECWMILAGVAAGFVTLVSSVVWFFCRRMIPGLSPLSLAFLLGLCGIWIHKKDLRDSFSFWMECIFLVASLLNAISGVLQIAVYYKH